MCESSHSNNLIIESNYSANSSEKSYNCSLYFTNSNTLFMTNFLDQISHSRHEFIFKNTMCFQPNIPYYIFLRTTNRAGSSIMSVSKPLMLDLLSPVPGNVVDGTDLMHDIKFQSSLTDVKGTNDFEITTLPDTTCDLMRFLNLVTYFPLM